MPMTSEVYPVGPGARTRAHFIGASIPKRIIHSSKIPKGFHPIHPDSARNPSIPKELTRQGSSKTERLHPSHQRAIPESQHYSSFQHLFLFQHPSIIFYSSICFYSRIPALSFIPVSQHLFLFQHPSIPESQHYSLFQYSVYSSIKVLSTS